MIARQSPIASQPGAFPLQYEHPAFPFYFVEPWTVEAYDAAKSIKVKLGGRDFLASPRILMGCAEELGTILLESWADPARELEATEPVAAWQEFRAAVSTPAAFIVARVLWQNLSLLMLWEEDEEPAESGQVVPDGRISQGEVDRLASPLPSSDGASSE